ncbi:MAG: hypothetical protein ACKVHQ_08065 [Gammaproteobacteria bacterium]|jgi:hypothetical protein
MDQEHTRSQEIRLPTSINQSEIAALTNVFSEADYVLNFNFNDRTLRVDYVFPDLSCGDIWEMITGIIPAARFSFLCKWKYTLYALFETNEQDHLLKHYGWNKYISDLYVTHHHVTNQRSNKHKLWQKYNQSVDKK